jgi:hypothetical protein
MLRTAGVGRVICNHVDDDVVDTDLVINTLLLHDMGNILKFKFKTNTFFYKDDIQQIDFYKQVQRDFQQKYGNDPDDATIKIIAEITDNKRIADICSAAHGDYIEKLIALKSYEEKIVYYCDMRVGPLRVMTLDGRFTDLKKRYPHAHGLNKYHMRCREVLEKQIQEVATIDLQTITEEAIKPLIEKLRAVII